MLLIPRGVDRKHPAVNPYNIRDDNPWIWPLNSSVQLSIRK